MNITFKKVNSGIVAARARIEIEEGIYLQEITILRKHNKLDIEFPKKSFRGKDGRMHHMQILGFDSEETKTLWALKIKEEYKEWSKSNKKVLVYESDE